MPPTTPVSYIAYERLYSINLDLDLEMSFRCDENKYRKICGNGINSFQNESHFGIIRIAL